MQPDLIISVLESSGKEETLPALTGNSGPMVELTEKRAKKKKEVKVQIRGLSVEEQSFYAGLTVKITSKK